MAAKVVKMSLEAALAQVAMELVAEIPEAVKTDEAMVVMAMPVEAAMATKVVTAGVAMATVKKWVVEAMVRMGATVKVVATATAREMD